MISKRDRAKLIDALWNAMELNVPDKTARQNIAVAVAQGLDLPFVAHFVEACTEIRVERCR